MSYIDKEKLIKADIASIENRVRHAFNQGYDLGFKDGKEKAKPLEQEPCEDIISRKSIKQKLQEHHDFFVNAYGGFSNLPQNDKSRVDEITNCISMVVNEPSVTLECAETDEDRLGN